MESIGILNIKRNFIEALILQESEVQIESKVWLDQASSGLFFSLNGLKNFTVARWFDLETFFSRRLISQQ